MNMRSKCCIHGVVRTGYSLPMRQDWLIVMTTHSLNTGTVGLQHALSGTPCTHAFNSMGSLHKVLALPVALSRGVSVEVHRSYPMSLTMPDRNKHRNRSFLEANALSLPGARSSVYGVGLLSFILLSSAQLCHAAEDVHVWVADEDTGDVRQACGSSQGQHVTAQPCDCPLCLSSVCLRILISRGVS